MHGKLTAVFFAESNGCFHDFIGTDGDAVIISRSQIRFVHPGCSAGNAAVTDDFQAGRMNLLILIKLFFCNLKAVVTHKIVPHIVDAHLLLKALFNGFRIVNIRVITI